MKKIFLMGLSLCLVAVLSVGGTLAYLQDQESDVNVMTLGNVQIEQHEYERELNDDGTYKTDTIDKRTSYVLKEFTQGKPLLPIVGDPNEPGNSPAYAGYDDTTVRMSQVDSYGGMQVFAGKNAQDKFVTVENTGKSDAYVRTLVAFEIGSTDGKLVMSSARAQEADATGTQPWIVNSVGTITIDGNNYRVAEYVYRGAADVNRHVNGILPAGDTTYPNLCQVYLKHNATNDDMTAIDGNGNGTLDIIVLSQAVQTAGFTDAKTALDTAFGESKVKAAEWFGGIHVPDHSIPDAKISDAGVVTLENGEKAVLSGNLTESITVNGNGSLYLRDLDMEVATGDALTVESTDVNLIVEGNVIVKSEGGSAITGEKLNISGAPGAALTAIAGDANGAFGIGGMNTTEININDLTIKEVRGGFDGAIGTDTKYYKDAPEGGSAIGSAKDGAAITLNNVHIEKAIGGSKSAGIGARYHVGVNVTITDSTIDYVEGGATAAGIGGSRVSGDRTERGTSIVIDNSTVKAVGGVYGAGIGSGYDTHCNQGQPICTINITGNSVITAKGGQYAAGIGTGYHNAGLAGTIADTVLVNATSGEKFYKDTYTQAQDVGFGVVDPAREGKDNNSSINYKGIAIGIPEVI